MKEYYNTLGLPTESSREEIKNARNNLLKKYHPDCFLGSADYAEQKTIEINKAFEAIMAYLDEQEEIVRAKAREKVEKETEREEKLQPKVGVKQEGSSDEDEEGYVFFASWLFSKIKQAGRKMFGRDKSKKEKVVKNIIKEDQEIKDVSKKQKEKISTSERKDKNILSFWIYGLILLGVVMLVLFFTGVL